MWLYKSLFYKDSCHVTSLDLLHMEVPSSEAKCDVRLESVAYRNFALLGVNVLMGQVILLLTVERVERRFLIICGSLLCGTCSLVLAFLGDVNTHTAKIGLCSLFLTSYSLLDSTVNIVIVEVFPTALRGTATGETQLLAGIGCMFLKKYLDVPCNIPFLLVGSFMLVAAVLAVFLPDFKGRSMME